MVLVLRRTIGSRMVVRIPLPATLLSLPFTAGHNLDLVIVYVGQAPFSMYA